MAGEELPIDPRRRVKVRVTAPAVPQPDGAYLDTSAFLVTRLGRVVDDRHFVFYGNAASPDGAVTFREIRDGDNVVDIDLGALGPGVDGIELTGTIYDADGSAATLAQVGPGMLRISDSTGQLLAEYHLGPVPKGAPYDGRVLGAIFRRDARWVFRASADVFPEGLRGVASGLGVAL